MTETTRRWPLKRDPFTRATLVRYLVPKAYRVECYWCDGQGRFRYRWEGDRTREESTPSAPNLMFCSRGCWESSGM